MRHLDKSILIVIHSRDAVLQQQEYKKGRAVLTRPRVTPYQLTLESERLRGVDLPASKHLRKLKVAVRREFGEEGAVNLRIYHHNSIHYYGHLLEGDRLKVLDENAANEDINSATGMIRARGDAVAFQVPQAHHKIAYSFIDNDRTVRILGPQEMRGQHIVMGFIWRLLRIEGNKYTSWAELEVVRPSRSKCYNVGLASTQIFLMPHPTKAATHVIFNHRFEWVITDLWPGEIRQEQDDHGEEEGSDHGEEEGSDHGED
ncbi:uncharacterized protein ACA1_131610 [Acanthamoeba castellanii str. Neff]|uniref:Uncharacterized protein n=1 Tax=Acanthamoeba castellanii (strain ATCC 30010 / Neff) TaxID=1257118 RepID=L8GN53_ACACF|nr:uncharacterized protein ACA1_131610 [Acanthamoeba castellanii str. Neff]ELR14168.1 hypothetical protein ACA1_131610 [Acanthamoeba castellanii str. Neff]